MVVNILEALSSTKALSWFKAEAWHKVPYLYKAFLSSALYFLIRGSRCSLAASGLQWLI